MTDAAKTKILGLDAVPEGLRDRHRAEAMVVLNALETALIERAEAHGGQVGAEEVRLLADTLRKQPDLFGSAFDVVAYEFHALGQRREFAAIRQDSFGRLLVSRFAHLLEGRSFGSLDDGALSRGILPPFFKAIRMMVGPETLEAMQADIENLVHELGSASGATDDPDFWLDLADNPESGQRVRALFIGVALRFDDYDRRKKWFIDLLNDNMPLPRPTQGGVPWSFDDRHFVYLMTALFRDIRALALDDSRAVELAEAYGGECVTKLRSIFAKLDEDIAALPEPQLAGVSD